MIFALCSIGLVAFFGKIAEFFFEHEESTAAKADKRLNVSGYNAWKNFNKLFEYFKQLFGSSSKRVILSSAIVGLGVMVGLFVFYFITILGISNTFEMLFSGDAIYNLSSNGSFLEQLIVKSDLVHMAYDNYYNIDFITILFREITGLSPLFLFIIISIISAILINFYLLRWLSRRRRRPASAFLMSALAVLLSASVDFLLIPTFIITIFVFHGLTGFGIFQETTYGVTRNDLWYGASFGGPKFTVWGGRISTEPGQSKEDFLRTSPRWSLIDAITNDFKITHGQVTRKYTTGEGGSVTSDEVDVCSDRQISPEICVKKARTFMLDRALSRMNMPTARDIVEGLKSLVQMAAYASPYVCSAATRDAVDRNFPNDWQRLGLRAILVPLYALIGLYLVRLTLGTIIPIIVISDRLIIGSVKKIRGYSISTKYQVIKNFGYLSILPIAVAIGVVHKIASAIC